MLIELDIFAKLFKLSSDKDQLNEAYTKYLVGANQIITQYTQDQIYLASLPESELRKIDQMTQTIEDPIELLNAINSVLPPQEKVKLQQAIEGAIDRYNQKVIDRGMAEMTDEETQELTQYVSDAKSDLTEAVVEMKNKLAGQKAQMQQQISSLSPQAAQNAPTEPSMQANRTVTPTVSNVIEPNTTPVNPQPVVNNQPPVKTNIPAVPSQSQGQTQAAPVTVQPKPEVKPTETEKKPELPPLPPMPPINFSRT